MQLAVWTKPNRCGSGASDCVEVRFNGETVNVRDSKDPDGPVHTYTNDEWRVFIKSVKAGQFDLEPELELV